MTGSWGRASGSRFVGRGLGHAADANARDAAIVCSIALQCGADIETIRRALSRDSRGHTTGPLGVALDLICGGTEIEAGGTPNNDGLDIPDYLKRDAKAGAA
jgi:hypothetical protein